MKRFDGHMLGALLCGAVSTVASRAHASPPPPPAAVDVTVHEDAATKRTFVLSWNPLPAFTIGKYSADLVFLPDVHHALVINAFYSSTSTAPIYLFDDSSVSTGSASAQLPEQTFRGVGGEIGYRYYQGMSGPRGLFYGASLILARMNATAQDGSSKAFFDLGVAGDVGYQVILRDRLSIGVGVGLQYLLTSARIPDQQFPSKIYANDRLLPRVLASIGWAL